MLSLAPLSERILEVVHNSLTPLTAREVTEQVYPNGEASPTRLKNVRRILDDLVLEGLLHRVAQSGRERVAWQRAA